MTSNLLTMLDDDVWSVRQIAITERLLLGNDWDRYYKVGDPDQLDYFSRLLAVAEMTILRPQVWDEQSNTDGRVILVNVVRQLQNIDYHYRDNAMSMEIAWKMASVLRRIHMWEIKLPGRHNITENIFIEQVLGPFRLDRQPEESGDFAGHWLALNQIGNIGFDMLRRAYHAHLITVPDGMPNFVTCTDEGDHIISVLTARDWLKPVIRPEDGSVSRYLYQITDSGIQLAEWFKEI